MKIFLDSNIPMYAAGAEHPSRAPSLSLLQKVRTGELKACTSTEVLEEILYRYTALGRLDLAGQVYDLFVELCPEVLPVSLADTDRARYLLARVPGISARDAVHAAVMVNHSLEWIATFHGGFDRVPGIRRRRLT